MAVTVKVRYLAVLKGLARQPELTISLECGLLSDLLRRLRESQEPALKSRLFSEGGGVRPDVLIFIDDVESSLIGGTGARLRDGCTVSLLPSVHGG